MSKQEKHEILNEFAKKIKSVYDEIINLSEQAQFVNYATKDFIKGFIDGAQTFRDMLMETIITDHICVEADINDMNESPEAYQKFLSVYRENLKRIKGGEWK